MHTREDQGFRPAGEPIPAGRALFGPFELDRQELTLLRDGVETPLPARSVKLLDVLVRSAGRTVPKDALVAEAWQGAHVSDTSLTEAISRLRRALGDDARRPRYVQTVHGRGYRFIAALGPGGSDRERRQPARRLWVGASIAASVALAGALWIGSVVVAGGRAPTDDAGGAPTGGRAMALSPFRQLARALRGPGPETDPDRIRYRLGEVTAAGSAPVKYDVPALPLNDLSVDRAGGRLAFSIAEGRRSDVWVLEPHRGELKRVVTGGYSSDPVWRPNGREVALARSRDRDFDLVLKDVDRAAPAQVLLAAPNDQFPESWTRDGRSLVYSERHPETGYDLWLLRQHGDLGWVPTPLVRTPGDEAFGAISPEGRFVAFVSSIGRRSDVFVVDLYGDRAPIRVSRDGGAYPFWSAAGDLLHYVSGDELRTVGAGQLAGDATRAVWTSTPVAGLYLAGSVAGGDRIVVAMLD